MKAFDLEAAKKGAPVCTRNGNKARIICFDRKHGKEMPIIALVEYSPLSDEEIVKTYNIDGSYTAGSSEWDLMMAPIKKKVWVNFYKSEDGKILTGMSAYNSKEEANLGIFNNNKWICTLEIEVEM